MDNHAGIRTELAVAEEEAEKSKGEDVEEAVAAVE